MCIEILRRSPSRLQNVVTVTMVIVTSIQTAMNFWTSWIMGRWRFFTIHKLLVVLVLFVALGAVWGCVAVFNRTDRRRTAVLFALAWVPPYPLGGFLFSFKRSAMGRYYVLPEITPMIKKPESQRSFLDAEYLCERLAV